MRFLLVFLLFPVTASAAQVCVDFSHTAIPQRFLVALSYTLLYQAGWNQVPEAKGMQVCVNDPPIDVRSVLSTSAMTTFFNAEEAKRQEIKAMESEFETLLLKRGQTTLTTKEQKRYRELEAIVGQP